MNEQIQEPRNNQNGDIHHKAVSGFVEVFNFIGQFIISNKFVGLIGNMFKEHIEVINFIIKENENKEFWKLINKYSLILLGTFIVRGFFGGSMRPMVFGVMALLSLFMIKLGGERQEINFEIYDDLEDVIEDIYEDKGTEKQKEPFQFNNEEPVERSKEEGVDAVTDTSMNEIRNMFASMRSVHQSNTEQIIDGSSNLIGKAMTPKMAEDLGIPMGSGEDRTNQMLDRLKNIKGDTHKKEEVINRSFIELLNKIEGI